MLAASATVLFCRAAWAGLSRYASRASWLRTDGRADRVRHLAADDSRYAVTLLDRHLAWHATSPRLHAGVRHLFADGVRHLARARFGDRRTGRIRHLLRVAFLRPRAGDVRHFARAAFLSGRANCVRHFASARLSRHRAGRVRHAAGARLLSHRASRVGDFASAGLRHRAADLVGDSAGARLWNPFGAADSLFDDFRAPDLAAADSRRALNLNRAAAAGLVGAATGAGILAPRSGILHALVHDRTGDALTDRLPFAAADIDVFCLGTGTANGVANVFVACLRHDFAGRVALVAPARLHARLADRVALISIARLVAWLTDVVALIAPARLRAGDTDGVGFIAIAGLIARHTRRAGLVAIAGLSHWAADGVALVAVASFVAGLRAADRNLFALLIVDSLVTDLFAAVPHDFLDRLVAGRTLLLSLTEITARRAS